MLRDLHTLTFADTAPMPELDYGAWWLMFADDEPADPVAFGGVVASTYSKKFAYLKRGGVVHSHRGHGLQMRLLGLRERWARREQFETLITDTSNDNVASSNNLIKAGFRLWLPEVRWGMDGGLYWRKDLSLPQR